MEDRILRTPEILELLGVSRVYLRRMVRDGKFPPPLGNLFHGERRPRLAWKENTVKEWLASRE